jgi:putative ABC transport system permease protein
VSPLRRAHRSLKEWRDVAVETVRLTHDSVAAHPLRSVLAVLGIVIGIVTVVLVASVLVNVRNSVALLFRELGTDNVFAYHRSGDPYAPPSEREARRLPL